MPTLTFRSAALADAKNREIALRLGCGDGPNDITKTWWRQSSNTLIAEGQDTQAGAWDASGNPNWIVPTAAPNAGLIRDYYTGLVNGEAAYNYSGSLITQAVDNLVVDLGGQEFTTADLFWQPFVENARAPGPTNVTNWSDLQVNIETVSEGDRHITLTNESDNRFFYPGQLIYVPGINKWFDYVGEVTGVSGQRIDLSHEFHVATNRRVHEVQRAARQGDTKLYLRDQHIVSDWINFGWLTVRVMTSGGWHNANLVSRGRDANGEFCTIDTALPNPVSEGADFELLGGTRSPVLNDRILERMYAEGLKPGGGLFRDFDAQETAWYTRFPRRGYVLRNGILNASRAAWWSFFYDTLIEDLTLRGVGGDVFSFGALTKHRMKNVSVEFDTFDFFLQLTPNGTRDCLYEDCRFRVRTDSSEYPNKIVFRDCLFEIATPGLDLSKHGVQVNQYTDVRFERCTFRVPDRDFNSPRGIVSLVDANRALYREGPVKCEFYGCDFEIGSITLDGSPTTFPRMVSGGTLLEDCTMTGSADIGPFLKNDMTVRNLTTSLPTVTNGYRVMS